MTTAQTDEGAPKKVKRDRTHWLYILVIVAVVAGIVVGLVAPETAAALGVLGELFVKLIKMMIVPVIFCTVVIGIGKVRAATAVGKVGGLAIGYFLIMSSPGAGDRSGGRQPDQPRHRTQRPKRSRQGRRVGR